MNSDFFYRPVWQQYLVSICCCLAVFVVIYLFVIHDIEQQAKLKANAYQQKITETALLQAKIERYQTSKSSLYSSISEHELAQLIEQHHLVLSSFKRYQTDQAVNWNIELSGQFFDFMNLLSSLMDDFYFLDFQNLKISKQDQQLQFMFTLLFKKDGK